MRAVKRILVVDDDSDDLLYFKEALAEVKPSIICETAHNGKDALQQIEIPPPPDVVFLDINMPVMNGYECLRALKAKEKFKDIPVIMFTTSKNVADIEYSRKLGAALYFTKPTDFSVLCKSLSALFGFDRSNLTNFLYS